MKVINEGMTVKQLKDQIEKYDNADKVYILDHTTDGVVELRLVKATAIRVVGGETRVLLLPPEK